MAGIILTYDIAMAAGKDAANRNMRKHCRDVWSDEDYNIAVARTEELALAFYRGNYGEEPASVDVAFMALAETRGMSCIREG